MALNLRELERGFAVFSFKYDTTARIRLWRKLGKLLTDGIPIVRALEELASLKPKGHPEQVALREWASVMNNGRKFSEAIKDWVTTEEAMLIMAGDQAGELGLSMTSVIKVTKAGQQIKQAVLSGISYPLFLIILSIGVLFLFNYKIIPAFAIAARGDRWMGMARTMIDVSTFMQNWFVPIVLVLVLAIVALFISMPLWTGPMRTKFDRYPPYSIYRIMQGSTWIISLSALIQSGLRIEKAMEDLMKGTAPWARERMGAALRGLKAGRDIGQSLAQTRYEFPDREIISDIQLYSSKSGFDEALKLIGDEWITESVERIQALMKKVFGVTLMISGAIIAFEVAGMFAMQIQLGQLIQQPGM
jgi:type II secretory pathway component PulF